MADAPPPGAGGEGGAGGGGTDSESEYSTGTSDSEGSFFDESELQEIERVQIEPGVRDRLMDFIYGSRRRKNRRKDRKLKLEKQLYKRKMEQVDQKLKYVTDMMDRMDRKADIKNQCQRKQIRVNVPEFAILDTDDTVVLPPGKERKKPQWTLPEIMKSRMIDTAFPKTRFMGEKDKGMGIREFLEAMNRGQKACFLTEDDFKEVLVMKCIGQPYKQVSNWISMGNSVESIYAGLYEIYNTDLPPIDAQNSLTVYRPSKGMTFPEMTADIEDKARQACLMCDGEEKRKEFYNNIAVMALSNGLPANSTRYVQEEKARQYAETGRPCTYQELVSGMAPMIEAINTELKSNPPNFQFGKSNKMSSNATAKGSDPSNYRKSGGNHHGHQHRGARVNNLSSLQSEQDDVAYVNALDSKPGPSKPYNSGKSYNSYSKPGGFQGRSQRVTGGRHYCSLCGAYDHNPADTCNAMRDDRGKVVVAALSTGPCQICKTKMGENLYHNENFCHIRDRIVELYRIGKVTATGKALEYINKLPGFKNGRGIDYQKPDSNSYPKNNSNGNSNSQNRFNKYSSNQQSKFKKNDSSRGPTGYRPKGNGPSRNQ